VCFLVTTACNCDVVTVLIFGTRGKRSWVPGVFEFITWGIPEILPLVNSVRGRTAPNVTIRKNGGAVGVERKFLFGFNRQKRFI
jgi:hypothetical protein